MLKWVYRHCDDKKSWHCFALLTIYMTKFQHAFIVQFVVSTFGIMAAGGTVRVSGNLVNDENATKKYIKATENDFLIYTRDICQIFKDP